VLAVAALEDFLFGFVCIDLNAIACGIASVYIGSRYMTSMHFKVASAGKTVINITLLLP
jgi:hypothetical protein